MDVPHGANVSLPPTPINQDIARPEIDSHFQAEAEADADAAAGTTEEVNAEDLDNTLLEVENADATTGTLLTREIIASFKSIFAINGKQFCRDFTSDSPSVQSSITFRNPSKQRASLVLHVTFPRHAKIDNPKKLSEHEVQLIFPVQAIVTIKYDALPLDTTISPVSHGLQPGQGLTRCLLATLDLTATQALITGGVMPALATSAMDIAAQDFLNAIRSKNITVNVILRRSEKFTAKAFGIFQRCMAEEKSSDPAKAWVKDSPTALALTMGNIKPLEDRPIIPLQRAETCFWDKMAHLIPVVYGAVFEYDYQRLLLNELTAQSFQMQLIEVPTAYNIADHIDKTAAHIKTTARVYLAFINFFDLNSIRPATGTRLKIRMLLDAEEETIQLSAQVEDNKEVPVSDAKQDALPPEKTTAPTEADKVDNAQDELGNEEGRDVFDMDAEDFEDDPDRHAWSGTIIDPTDITPPGHITIMLERRRQPGWTGPRQNRPFVDTPLDTVNYRLYSTTTEVAEAITNGPTIEVRVSYQFEQQGLKDMVRCCDQLWRSRSESHLRISQALLCHDTTNSPLLRINVLQLKGTSKLNLHLNFNTAQLEWYNSLSSTLEYSLLHGPYGSGKTRICVATATEIISNPNNINRVLYAVETNEAVDEVALEFERLITRSKLKKKLIRLHSLPGEKSAVYPLYDKQEQLQDRYTDVLLSQLSVEEYISTLSDNYKVVRARGDPRRVLTRLSLSHAMHQKLKLQSNNSIQALDELLDEYGLFGFNNTSSATRTKIKQGLNDLLAETLAEQDVIVCTLAAAAKVNLATNFKPIMTILDEAGRVPEAKSLIITAMFPDAKFHLRVGDHLQMGPYCQSYGREKDTIPFLNPFASQYLLSEFERLIRNGVEYKLLTLQHRCQGDISRFVSDTFYHGQVQTASLAPNELVRIDNIRKFVVDKLGAKTFTNRYMRFIANSRSEKEPGGTSSINDIEASALVADLQTISAEPLFAHMKVGILTFYKGQLVLLKRKCAPIQRASTLDIHFMTVASCQGTQFDIVLLSFVKTTGITFINEPRALLVALSRASLLFGMYSTEDLVANITKPSINNFFIFKLFEDINKYDHNIDSDSLAFTPCSRCHKNGHIARNCIQCRRCLANGDIDRAPGHKAKDCPFYGPDPAKLQCRECNAFGHKRASCPKVKCNRCNEYGHISNACPAPVKCSKCRLYGHVRKNCDTVITREHVNSIRPIPVHPLFEETPADNVLESMDKTADDVLESMDKTADDVLESMDKTADDVLESMDKTADDVLESMDKTADDVLESMDKTADDVLGSVDETDRNKIDEANAPDGTWMVKKDEGLHGEWGSNDQDKGQQGEWGSNNQGEGQQGEWGSNNQDEGQQGEW
ncbi:hypothetical protein B7494_g2949 [Chlorociboria aeruginascens]|nr:hypothetical protein B7494_g2949 [Chlorociboria aeruginascens]